MKGTLKVELKLRDGTVLQKGDIYEVIPPVREAPWESFIALDIDKQVRINTTKLGRCFKEFEIITMGKLQEAVMDGVCQSMTGCDVEPDGWDRHGFPSMLLAMGMI